MALLLSGALGLSACSTKTDTTTTTNPPASSGVTTTDAPSEPASQAADDAGQVNVTKGTFVEIEWGDYPHFNMKDEKGEDVSFWLAPDLPDDQYEKFESGDKKGAKIEVKWRTIERDIPENGGMMELEEVFEIKEL